jgi:AcrR family transcriptional regulator
MARGDTREEILTIGMDLLQRRGFSGFSFAHIAEKLDVKTAAVHYHFPTKTDLGLAIIERFRSRYRAWMDDARINALPPWVQLEGYFAIAVRFLDDGVKVCPAGVLQAEFGSIPEAMQSETRHMVAEIDLWLTGLLDAGRAAGAFRFEGRPSDKAVLIEAVLQGALQIARTLGRDHFHAALRQLRLELSP